MLARLYIVSVVVTPEVILCVLERKNSRGFLTLKLKENWMIKATFTPLSMTFGPFLPHWFGIPPILFSFWPTGSSI